MNKTNRNINLVLRIGLILTWITSIVSMLSILSGLKGVDTQGMNEKNVGERLLAVIGDFADKTNLYYVTLGMVAVCLVLSVITRYKTKKGSYIGKITALFITLTTMINGLDFLSAIRSCKGLSNITVTGTDAGSVAASLTAAGFSGNAETVAQTLTDKDAAGALVAGYMIPILILFVLVITSVHCLVKRSDPNNTESGE